MALLSAGSPPGGPARQPASSTGAAHGAPAPLGLSAVHGHVVQKRPLPLNRTLRRRGPSQILAAEARRSELPAAVTVTGGPENCFAGNSRCRLGTALKRPARRRSSGAASLPVARVARYGRRSGSVSGGRGKASSSSRNCLARPTPFSNCGKPSYASALGNGFPARL